MRHTTPIGIFVCTAVECAVLVPRIAGAAPPGRAYQLTHAVIADPSPAPDGRRMVYLGVVADHEQLFVANLDGSRPVQITRDDFIANADGTDVRNLTNHPAARPRRCGCGTARPSTSRTAAMSTSDTTARSSPLRRHAPGRDSAHAR
jgi:hypothetical protein